MIFSVKTKRPRIHNCLLNLFSSLKTTNMKYKKLNIFLTYGYRNMKICPKSISLFITLLYPNFSKGCTQPTPKGEKHLVLQSLCIICNIKNGNSQQPTFKKAQTKIIWKITQKLVEIMAPMETSPFGDFLSQQFQQPLSNYIWKSHQQKMYILQIVKFLNAHEPQQSFIRHGKKWAAIIKAIKQKQFQSEMPADKGELRLELYKFQYAQSRKGISQLEKTAVSINQKSPKKANKVEPKQKDKYYLDKQKQLEKQLLSRQQINVFLVVKDQNEQKQIYRLQILNQIINCRPLMCRICQQYWQSLAYDAILQIYQRMEDLNYLVRTDVLLSKLFLNLLRYRRTATIIRDKVGQQIVVRIIKNIQLQEKNSPFQNKILCQIPTLVNQAFFYITPEMAAQGVTIQSIIFKRIRSIIEQANAGKDDIVNRSLMTVSCRQQMILRKSALNQIIQFLINVKKKKGVTIQTCIILVKILLSSIRSPQIKQLQVFNLALSLTQSTQMYIMHKKVNQLRKLAILLNLMLIPLMKLDFTQQGLLVDQILKWLNLIQNNFSIVFVPMIKIITALVDRYKDYFSSQQKSVQVLEKILTGINEKLGHQHNNDNMFSFLECILKSYIKLNWSTAFSIYQDIPQSSFIDWEILYRKQARIIFKKEDEAKLNAKKAQQQAKLAKQREWNNNVLKRKQVIARRNKEAKKQEQVVAIDFIAQQLKCHQTMQLYFGEQERKWLKQLVTDHLLWRRQNIMRSQFGCLQFSLIQTVCTVEKQYYLKTHRPNQFIKKIVLELDSDIYDLFMFLMEEQSYQLLFLFASKIYFLCKDFFFVEKLKSYRLIQSKCFQILSVFFNKVQILYASSLFCSLLLPYANHKQLKQVYDYLNQEQFLTDLFKGSNQFIGKQKCYYPWLIKILMAYQITEQFRVNQQLVKQSLISLGKNVTWWGNVEYMINSQIQIYQNDAELEQNNVITSINSYGNEENFKQANDSYINKRLIFDLFKQQYKKLMDDYYSRIEKTINIKSLQKVMNM